MTTPSYFFFSLLLFAAFFNSLPSVSNSSSLTITPPWTAFHQLQTRAPEFNVVAGDDGVPKLESGEKAAQDPEIIVEGPLPVDTPEPINSPDTAEPGDDGNINNPTPLPSDTGTDDDSNPFPTVHKKPRPLKSPSPSNEIEEPSREQELITISADENPDIVFSSVVEPSITPKVVETDVKESSSDGNEQLSPEGFDDDLNVVPERSDSPAIPDSKPFVTIEEKPPLPSEEVKIDEEGPAEPFILSSDSDDAVFNDSFSCVFFGEGEIPNHALAERRLINGTVDTYAAAKTSFKTLPPQYLSHTYGKSWSYSLQTTLNSKYDIVLGFAEIYNEACASSTGSGFRLFSVSVGTQLSTIDVMESVGCGKPLRKVFSQVQPQDEYIKLSFKGLKQNAMLSTMCYRPSEPSDDDAVRETPTPAISSGLAPIGSPERSPAAMPSSSEADKDEDSNEQVRIVGPSAAYSCLNFATKSFDGYELFDESSMEGNVTIYKGSGISRNPTLPLPYRYHTYGEKWTYHLNVSTNSPQNVILGFAEVFPKACASGRNGSFRVFTVTVGESFRIVDVMKSSGCGVVLQTVFENVNPDDGLIELSFNAVSGKAMVSVACYADAGAAGGELSATTPRQTATPGPSKSIGNSVADTKQSQAQCFQFSNENKEGFTHVAPAHSTHGGKVQVYSDKFASVNGTPNSEIYKSHIFGQHFTLTLQVGPQSLRTVELGFAEIYEPGCKEGFRVFTVQAGAKSRTIDVFEEVGCSAAFIFRLQNLSPDSSGKIDIMFKAISNFAMVSSVCIIGSDSGRAPSLSITSADSGQSDPSLDEGKSESIEVSAEGSDISVTPTGEEDLEIEVLSSSTPLPFDESSDEQSTGSQVDDQEDAEEDRAKSSPLPKENGVIVVGPTQEGSNSQAVPSRSSFPVVNGIIDASLTTSPVATESPTVLALPALGDGSSPSTDGEEASPNPSDAGEDVQPTDELLPSDFSQTTLGEGSSGQPTPTANPTKSSSEPPSQNGFAAVPDSSNASPSPSTSSKFSENPVPSVDNEIDVSPTRTPDPTVAIISFVGGGNGNVTGKQNEITIEAPSPSPSVLTVTIEAPSPSSTELTVTIEAPSRSPTAESVTIVGTGPGTSASVTPTPTVISAAAFSPVPSATAPPPSPSPSQEIVQAPPTGANSQPAVTAVQPDSTSAESSSKQTASSSSPAPSLSTSASDEVLAPVTFGPTSTAAPQSSNTGNPLVVLPSSSDILPPAEPSPDPQANPNGPGATIDGVSSPPPTATISQNQIVVLPSTSVQALPTQTPAAVSPPSPVSSPVPSQDADPDGNSTGIGPPQGVATGSTAPDTVTTPNESPIPDTVGNPSNSPGSSPRAVPSPSKATSSVGSSEVIVDSPDSESSPIPAPSISIGEPEEGPVEVSDNTTEVIQVTGDIGASGSEEDKQPSILVGEYKDLIATTPAGSGFAIAMGIVGSLLVILLLVCLFFAIFRGGGAAYSYSSGYSSHKPTDYDPSQGGGYTDDQGLGPAGYGNERSYGQNTQDGYGPDQGTFESRPGEQSEAFGFEMPAVGGLGAPEGRGRTNEEPDMIAEYSSLNLQQGSGYESTAYRKSHVLGDTTRKDVRRINDSYGSNPGEEYTFTGTFTMPNAEYTRSQRDREHEGYGDRAFAEKQGHFPSFMQDSFNDNHSTARPMNESESSGKQERTEKKVTSSKATLAVTARGAHRTEGATTSEDGGLVDDVRSSLLDSEHASASHVLSMSPNPLPAQSPYETLINVNVAESDSGNVTARNSITSARDMHGHLRQRSWRAGQEAANHEKIDTELCTFPLLDKPRNESLTDAKNFERAHTAGRFALPSSGSNDEPWPWWWSGEDKIRQQKSHPYADPNQRTDGKENSSISSNSLIKNNIHRPSGLRKHQSSEARSHKGTPVTSRSPASEKTGGFVPDSNWRRQYSSTSDEHEEETLGNPDFEELRRRREPYVKSVTSRLSTGPGSCSMSASNRSVMEHAGRQFAMMKSGGSEFEAARSWITQEAAEA